MPRKRAKVAKSSRMRDMATTSSPNRIEHGAFTPLDVGPRLRKSNLPRHPGNPRDAVTSDEVTRAVPSASKRHGAFITLRAGPRLQELKLPSNPGREPHYMVAFQCEICFYCYPWDQVVLDRCPGPCAFCQDCLQIMIEGAIGDWSQFDIYCSRDNVLDPTIILENARDKSTVHRYLEVKLKAEDVNVTYCHSCRQYLQKKGARAKSNVRSCGQCETETCIVCGQQSHKSGPCPVSVPQDSEGDKEALNELAEDHKWKRCPTCRSWIEFNGGCSRMVCRCGSRFCWHCCKDDCICPRAAEVPFWRQGWAMDVMEEMAAMRLERELARGDVDAWRTGTVASAHPPPPIRDEADIINQHAHGGIYAHADNTNADTQPTRAERMPSLTDDSASPASSPSPSPEDASKQTQTQTQRQATLPDINVSGDNGADVAIEW